MSNAFSFWSYCLNEFHASVLRHYIWNHLKSAGLLHWNVFFYPCLTETLAHTIPTPVTSASLWILSFLKSETSGYFNTFIMLIKYIEWIIPYKTHEIIFKIPFQIHFKICFQNSRRLTDHFQNGILWLERKLWR